MAGEEGTGGAAGGGNAGQPGTAAAGTGTQPGTAAAGTGAAAAGAGAADPTQGGKTLPIGGADGAQPQTYKPEGIAPHNLGQTDKDTIDNLMRENKGFRDAQAKGPQVPEKPDAYQFNWSDKVKAAGSIASDDAAIAEFGKIAHEAGYTQQQMDAIPKFFDMAVDKGWIDKPIDPSQLLSSLAPEGFKGSPEEIERKGSERLLTAEGWIKQLPAQAGYDEAMKTELRLLTTSKDGIRVIEAMMKGGMNASVGVGGGQQTQAVSKSELDARVADPRNEAYGPKFDPAFAEETRKLFKQMYPE